MIFYVNQSKSEGTLCKLPCILKTGQCDIDLLPIFIFRAKGFWKNIVGFEEDSAKTT